MLVESQNSNLRTDPMIGSNDQPVILLDINFGLRSVNSAAKKFFGYRDHTISTTALLLKDDEVAKLARLMEEIKLGETKKIELKFQTASGEASREVNVKLVAEGDEALLMLQINPGKNGTAGNLPLGLKVPSMEIEELIEDKKILSIISEIQSSFPFTFLGKTRIQNEINKLGEPFWIKDINDKYILVNTKYAQSLGLRPMQVEGKSEVDFVPQFYRSLYNSVQQFVRDTANIVITDGIPLKGGYVTAGIKNIQVPIIDAERRVIASISFAQPERPKLTDQVITRAASFIEKVFSEFHIPAMIFDSRGITTQLNKEFCILQNVDLEDNIGVHFTNIVDNRYSKGIETFISSNQNDLMFYYSKKEGNADEILYQARLKKIKLSEEDFVVFFSLEKILSYDNLEELLKNRGRMFDILIRYNPEAIFIYDAETLRFIEVNEAALRLYGYRREEFLQMDLTDLYSPEDIQTLLDPTSSKNTPTGYAGPFKHRRKDGTIVMVELSKTPFKYENTEAHFNIVKDVSELIEKEKQFQLFKAAFEHTSDMLFITDPVGFIKYVNNSVKNVLGLDKHELIDASFVTLVNDDQRGDLNSSIFYSSIKEPVELEVSLKKATEGDIKCKIFATPILNSSSEIDSFNILAVPEIAPVEIIKEVPKVVVKEIVKEVYRDKGIYSDKAAPVTAGLDTAQISIMFHDLLTPINVILGFIQEIKESLDSPTEEQIEALEFINQNRDNLLDIMNSIAEYSAIGTQANPENSGIVKFIETLEKEVAQTREKWKKDLIISRVSSSLQINTDIEKFSAFLLLFYKICSKLTIEGQLYLSVQLLDDDNFILSFKDNSARVSERLSDNFSTVVLKKDFGMGKALGISKFAVMSLHKLLTLLKGESENISKDGQIFELGFRFPVRLAETESTAAEAAQPSPEALPKPSVLPPRTTMIEEPQQQPVSVPKRPAATTYAQQAKAAVPVPPPAPAPSVPPAKKELDLNSLKCLYIEDQVDSQILFKVQMKELKEIKFAVSFEEALPMMSMFQFDFIVMDINLQGEYNGLDALKIIRTMPEFSKIPVIAVTAYVLPGDREKFIAAGFNDFISKPIFREKMIDALHKIFA